MEFVRNAYFISCYLSPKMIDKCLQMVHISRMIQMISPTNKKKTVAHVISLEIHLTKVVIYRIDRIYV